MGKYKGVDNARFKKKKLAERDGIRCYLCGREDLVLDELVVDHKLPHSRGGSNGLWNLGLACTACDKEKGDMTPEEYWEFRVLAPARNTPGGRRKRREVRLQVRQDDNRLMYGIGAVWPESPKQIEVRRDDRRSDNP